MTPSQVRALEWVFKHWGNYHASERMVMVALAYLSTEIDPGLFEASPLRAELADWSGVSQRHVLVCLKQLEEDGLIRRRPATTGRAQWRVQFGNFESPAAVS